MKLLFENWRRYLSEARPRPQLQRVLHDIAGYGGDVTPGKYDDPQKIRFRQKSTVGYDLSDDDITKIKTEMENTPQDWMIITAKNLGSVQTFASPKDKQDFQNWFDRWIKEWLEKQNKPENFLDNTIFFVIQSPRLTGDSTGSQWFIHDVFGHSINYVYERTPPMYKKVFNSRFINYVQQEIGGTATADFDRLPDVFSAIILGKLSQEKMKEYAKNYLQGTSDPKTIKSVNETVTDIFDYTNWWINTYLKERGPKNLYFIELWNPTDPNDK